MSLLPRDLFGIALQGGLAAGLLTLFAALFWLKRDGDRLGLNGEQLSGWLANSVLIGFGATRLLALAEDPGAALAHPILTFVHGGGWSWAEPAGWLAGAAYLIWKIRRDRGPLLPLMNILARTGVIAFGVYSLFEARAGRLSELPFAVEIGGGSYHPVNLYHALLAFLFALWLWKTGRGLWTSLFGMGCLLLLVSFLQVHLSTVLGLAPLQWVSLAMAIIGYGGLVWRRVQ